MPTGDSGVALLARLSQACWAMTSQRRREDRVIRLLYPPEAATCAVCRKELEPCLDTELIEFAGRAWWLCGARCKDEFDRQPLGWSEEAP